jgi:hypothetical protein
MNLDENLDRQKRTEHFAPHSTTMAPGFTTQSKPKSLSFVGQV